MDNAQQAKAAPKSYLRPAQIESIKNDIQVMERMLNERHLADPSQTRARLSRTRKFLQDSSPPDVGSEEREKLAKESKVLEEEIRSQMLSRDEMMRNPQGAVGRFLQTEGSSTTKAKIQRWKEIQLTIHRGTSDMDVANAERLRPARPSMAMVGMQIPPKIMSSPSREFMDNYDGIDWSNGQDGVTASLLAKLDELEKRLNEEATKRSELEDAVTSAPARSSRPPLTASLQGRDEGKS